MTLAVSLATDAAPIEQLERALDLPRELRVLARETRVVESFLATVDGAPVGTATLARYDGADDRPALAWVGGMSVLPERRGKGVGRALLDACVARAADAPTVGLDAADDARPLYARAGFRDVSRSTRWQRAGGAARPPTGGPHSVHPISLSEAMEIAEYDLPRFGAKRLRWLFALVHASPWTAFMARDRRAGHVTGYALGHARGIGPLVAEDDDAAAALLAACELAGAPPKLLVPDDHAGARQVLEAAGWTPTDLSVTRMLLRGAMPGRAANVYAYASWALG